MANSIAYLQRSLEKHAQVEEEALKNGAAAIFDMGIPECQVILSRLINFIYELVPLPGDGKRQAEEGNEEFLPGVGTGTR